MKICAAQTDIVWENKQHNMRIAAEILRKSSENGAKLTVFPELSLTGFTMNKALSEPVGGETEEFFSKITGELKTAVAFGYACAHDGVVTNRLCVADNGRIIAFYDKIHPFSYGGEKGVYTGGERLSAFEICGETVGLTVCYDLRFPEIYTALSEKCSVILVIANWPEKRAEQWDILLRARAVENQCYIVGCNRCGEGGGLYYSGGSEIISPTGEIMAAAKDSGLIYADISGAACEKYRRDFPVKNDRKKDLYGGFYKQEGFSWT